MKNILKALRLTAVGIFAIATTACGTVDYRTVAPWQGQVWRGVVVAQFVNTAKFTPTDKGFLESTKYDDKVHHGLRMARVHISSGWDSVMANAIVPDAIEFAEIPKGTLVDMMTETGPSTDHSKERYTRIIRVVCRKDDERCLDVEAKAKRIRAVIDEHPGPDISAKYGLTFKRRVTKEELDKYN